jgi:hypothetical protein
MTLKHQKLIVALLVTLAAFGGFEALIYLVNLNQITIFLWVALAIWLYLWVKISFLYDLHFKNPGALKRAVKRHESISHWLHRSARICCSAAWDRFEHFRKWESLKHWLNYLLLEWKPVEKSKTIKNLKWWKTLNRKEQKEYIKQHPGSKFKVSSIR